MYKRLHGQPKIRIFDISILTQTDETAPHHPDPAWRARQAGHALKELLGDVSVYFYISPFWRTRSTFENIVRSFPRSQFRYSEEPRLREQEWGYLRTYGELKRLKAERTAYGAFYYRFPGGEAGTDVYDRINDLLGSLHRDFRDKDYPRNCVLITHSLAIRLFVMRWFHLTVEEFEEMRSPANCALTILELDETGDEYRLLTPLARNPEAPIRRRPIRLPEPNEAE